MTLIKNSRHTLDISTLSPEGQGIGEIEGQPVIVDRALPGECAEVKLIKVARNYAVGRLLRALTPSADRVQPFCEAFTRCGGCTLQHLQYEAQCRLKTVRLRDTFAQAGFSDSIQIHDILGMATPFRYRNKAQYPVARRHGAVRMGFYARHSHDIIEHAACDIQPAIMTRIRDVVKAFLEKRQVSIYNETTHTGLVRHLLIRQAMATGECMLVLVINGDTLPHHKELTSVLTGNFSTITSIQVNHNTQDTNSILGPAIEVLWGKSTITDRLGEYWFEISAHAFYQVNSEQTALLYQKVQEFADLQGTETVFDLYCGIGTIAISLAHHAGYVYGIDSVSQAIGDANTNAAKNAVENVGFLHGMAEKVFPDMVCQGVSADVVILDPPRKGCAQPLLDALTACQPKRIVYVSCHPKTLIRDLHYLTRHGFRCVEVQPVDMFPHTMHTECVASIIRSS